MVNDDSEKTEAGSARAVIAASEPTPSDERTGVASRWNHSAVAVLSISFLLLFVEMALIRWAPAQVRVIAYVSSVVLIACFLGQGAGCVSRSRRDWMPLFPWSLLSLVTLLWYLGKAGVRNPTEGFFFRLGNDTMSWLVAVSLVFAAIALTLVPLGQRLSCRMGELRPLVGYSANLVGSLLGTGAFVLCSLLGAPPGVWFAVVAVVSLLHLPRRGLVLLGGVAAGIATVVLVQVASQPFLWSPYYKIAVSQLRAGDNSAFALTVNDDYHQLILDLSPKQARSSADLAAWAATYDFPYTFARTTSPEVLVLGAGTGNDTAAALRHNARQVDAVELDPVIAQLGRQLHPERPYFDPRVRVVVNDARSVLNSSQARYDLVVFGWLDSHRVFSSLSNVRQDNFVYTVEAMRSAVALLKPGGALVLSFYAGKPWVATKIDAMLRAATNRSPRAFALADGAYGPSGVIFVVTQDGTWPGQIPAGFVELTDRIRPGSVGAVPPTDRWPFLYWERPSLPREYMLMLGLVLGIALALVVPKLRGGQLPAREGAHFFLLGAGFLLLEVRNITALALVFGSTWMVTSVVVAAVLGMALLATAFVARGWGERGASWWWFGLVVSILAGLLWSRVGTAALDSTLRAVVTTLVISATFAFTGVIFARSFSRTASPGTALGLNVLGSVGGGLAEFGSLIVGLDGLVVLALAVYALAALTVPRAKGIALAA
jgi:hypothetical protein